MSRKTAIQRHESKYLHINKWYLAAAGLFILTIANAVWAIFAGISVSSNQLAVPFIVIYGLIGSAALFIGMMVS